MKSVKILLVAVFAIFSLNLFAQDSTKQKSKPKKQKIEAMVYTCSMHPEVVSNKPGNCPKCGMKLVKKETKSVTYTCPMHPEVKSDKPGKCPKCGMDLVESKKTNAEHKH